MDAIGAIRKLFDHHGWADEQIIGALRSNPSHEAVRREYAHIIAAETIWLDRLRGAKQRIAVWPDLSVMQTDDLRRSTRAEFETYLAGLDASQLDSEVAYVTSAGAPFTNTVGEILLHVALHGQYHRGKVNLLLRQTDNDPMPTDFIAFVRGAPAARS